MLRACCGLCVRGAGAGKPAHGDRLGADRSVVPGWGLQASPGGDWSGARPKEAYSLMRTVRHVSLNSLQAAS